MEKEICKICGKKEAANSNIPVCRSCYQNWRNFCIKWDELPLNDYISVYSIFHTVMGDIKLTKKNLIAFSLKNTTTLPESFVSIIPKFKGSKEKISEEYKDIPIKRRDVIKIKSEEGFPGGVKFLIEANEKGGIIRCSTFTFTAVGNMSNALSDFAKLRDMIKI